MAKKSLESGKRTVLIKGTLLSVESLLTFYYLHVFERQWAALGLMEGDLAEAEEKIMLTGRDSPIIPETYGLRKMRFAPIRLPQGQSGAYRICFVYFQRFGSVLMVTVYGKSEQENLSQKFKQGMKDLIQQAESAFEVRAKRKSGKVQ